MLSGTSTCALWASILSVAGRGHPYQISDTDRCSPSIGPSTARDALCVENATNPNPTDGQIEVNHRVNSFKRQARELLTGGLAHRSTRPVEPEAVFGDIKFNHGFKRFRLRSNRKVKVEFGLVALAHNLRKYSAMLSGRTAAQSPASATA